jgi:hypothetical protein
LNPVITDSDLFEFVNSIKMVAFLGKECEQRRILIQKKIDAINKLKSSVTILIVLDFIGRGENHAS